MSESKTCSVCGETMPDHEICILKIAGAAKAGEPCPYSEEGIARTEAFLAEHDEGAVEPSFVRNARTASPK